MLSPHILLEIESAYYSSNCTSNETFEIILFQKEISLENTASSVKSIIQINM